MSKDALKFCCLLLGEFFFLPLLFFSHWYGVLFRIKSRKRHERKPVQVKKVRICVHEWGGYSPIRSKTIKRGNTFDCGLAGQIARFEKNDKCELSITISGPHLNVSLADMKQKYNVSDVDNIGMDFSGYSSFYANIKNMQNGYVILTNSSVNAVQEEFLDGYVAYMEKNLDVGILGVSYCTKMIQTLVKPNFTPHLQSFFLMTTIDVLNEVVKYNNNKFPGAGISHKLLLIRQGEIKISRIVQKLGYRLAVVNPIDGIPYKFESYKAWKLPFGDIRQLIDTPNRITPIIYDNSIGSNI